MMAKRDYKWKLFVMIMAQGDDHGWNGVIKDLGDPRMVARARSTKAKEPNNGDIARVDSAALLNVLPIPIRNRVQEMGYVPRYFAIPAMRFSSILERCLAANKGNGTILNYNSSNLKKQKLLGDLVYYSIIHVDVSPPRTSLESRLPRGEGIGEGGNNADVIVIAIYNKGDDGSIVITSADNVMDCDKWIDDVSSAYLAWNAARQTKTGGGT